MFRLALGVLRGYTQGRASSGWFRGLGCSLGRAGPAVWRVLIAASCVLKPPRLWSLLQLAFSGWPVYFFSAQFALLGVIADSEYVDSMGYNRTSRLYANSSGPHISTIRPTAAWSTPAVSLTLDSSRLMRSFLRRTLPVDDVCSCNRTLY